MTDPLFDWLDWRRPIWKAGWTPPEDEHEEPLSESQAARFVTGDKGSRALRRFREFIDYLVGPNELINEETRLLLLKAIREIGYWPSLCENLKEIFRSWKRIKKSRAQPKHKKPRPPNLTNLWESEGSKKTTSENKKEPRGQD